MISDVETKMIKEFSIFHTYYNIHDFISFSDIDIYMFTMDSGCSTDNTFRKYSKLDQI